MLYFSKEKMSKFYVYIQVNAHNIKFNREDVLQVHSQLKKQLPPLPSYHHIHKGSRSPSMATSASDQEYMSLEVENKDNCWTFGKIHPFDIQTVI